MKKILFVTSNLMPVPAVKGGAVETLLQILAEENEKEQKAEFYIICRYDIVNKSTFDRKSKRYVAANNTRNRSSRRSG